MNMVQLNCMHNMNVGNHIEKKKNYYVSFVPF